MKKITVIIPVLLLLSCQQEKHSPSLPFKASPTDSIYVQKPKITGLDVEALLKTNDIPDSLEIAETTNAKRAIDIAVQHVLTKLDLPNALLMASAGTVSTEHGAFLSGEGRGTTETYKTSIRDSGKDIDIRAEVVSLYFYAKNAGNVHLPSLPEVRVGDRLFSLWTASEQPQHRYAHTISAGIQVTGRLGNGRVAAQIVYLNLTVILSPEEIATMHFQVVDSRAD